MLSTALALASALIWGTGDFLGGLASRRYGFAWVVAATAFGGILLGTTLSLLSGDPLPGSHDVLLASAAGLAGLIGLSCFYHALAIGTMSIVAPISASGAAVPVFWGLTHGESLSLLAAIATVVLVGGVMLASQEQTVHEQEVKEGHALSVLLALAAAFSFGTIFTIIGVTADASIYWPSTILKVSTFACAVIFLFALRARESERGVRPRGLGWAWPVSIGFFDLSANVIFAAATNHGALAIASVISSLYPVVTVLLAYLILRERLSSGQRIGVVLALAGVAVLGAS